MYHRIGRVFTNEAVEQLHSETVVVKAIQTEQTSLLRSECGCGGLMWQMAWCPLLQVGDSSMDAGFCGYGLLAFVPIHVYISFSVLFTARLNLQCTYLKVYTWMCISKLWSHMNLWGTSHLYTIRAMHMYCVNTVFHPTLCRNVRGNLFTFNCQG